MKYNLWFSDNKTWNWNPNSYNQNIKINIHDDFKNIMVINIGFFSFFVLVFIVVLCMIKWIYTLNEWNMKYREISYYPNYIV